MHPDAFVRAEEELKVRKWWPEDLAPVAAHHAKGGVVVLPLDGTAWRASGSPSRTT